jgi:hypothetical protein
VVGKEENRSIDFCVGLHLRLGIRKIILEYGSKACSRLLGLHRLNNLCILKKQNFDWCRLSQVPTSCLTSQFGLFKRAEKGELGGDSRHFYSTARTDQGARILKNGQEAWMTRPSLVSQGYIENPILFCSELIVF